MSFVIAVAGKGGTGKTTLAALLVRLLAARAPGEVLAVDADPNSNLGEVLGLQEPLTVGGILDDLCAHPEQIPPATPKERFIELKVHTAIQEAQGFDVLSMGRPEGPGCYCYVNNVTRGLVGSLIKDYRYVVIDNEAGLEHLSRRTTRRADVLLAVSDPTVVGLRAAARVAALVEELKISVGKRFLIVNRADKDAEVADFNVPGLTRLGTVPHDPALSRLAREGRPVLELDQDAPSLAALRTLGEQLWQK